MLVSPRSRPCGHSMANRHRDCSPSPAIACLAVLPAPSGRRKLVSCFCLPETVVDKNIRGKFKGTFRGVPKNKDLFITAFLKYLSGGQLLSKQSVQKVWKKCCLNSSVCIWNRGKFERENVLPRKFGSEDTIV